MLIFKPLKLWKEVRSVPPIQNSSRSQLPQELIDKIIDDVALKCYEDGDSKLNDLKACSLVSKSFYARSRRHIFSQILFTIDKYCQRRAARLLDILHRHEPFADFVTHNLHTFGLAFYDSATSEPFVLRMLGLGESFTKLQKRITRTFTRNDHIYNLLKTLNQAPIVHFSLEGWRLFGSHPDHDEHQINGSALHIIKNPSLRALRFSELIFLPQTIVKNALCSYQLKELAFRRIFHFVSTPGDSDNFEGLQIAPKLERLELRRVPYTSFLSILFSLTLSNVAARTIPTFPEFRHLRTLVVTIANLHSETESLWTLLLGLAPSLETLDIQHTGWLEHPWPATVCLSQLTALKHLIFTSSLSSLLSVLYEEYITSLLLSASSPIILESIEINLYKQGNSPQEVHDSFHSDIGWNEIDRSLNNPNFVHLTSFTCNLRPFHSRSTTPMPVENPIAQRIDPTLLLPLTHFSPSVELNFYLMSMSGPHEMYS